MSKEKLVTLSSPKKEDVQESLQQLLKQDYRLKSPLKHVLRFQWPVVRLWVASVEEIEYDFKEHQQVRSLVNVLDRGVTAGDIGTIVHVYDSKTFEVEFPDPDDVPAVAKLKAWEIRACDETVHNGDCR